MGHSWKYPCRCLRRTESQRSQSVRRSGITRQHTGGDRLCCWQNKPGCGTTTSARGIQALSLDGGMKAWSLAWNIAEISLPSSQARVIQVRRTGKGCLSYFISVGKTAVVIDASLDPQVYLDLAHHYGWQIERVLDTHIHADHLSRSRRLAQMSGATLFLPDQTRVSFPFTPIHDGDTLEPGTATLTALHTPGHTPESTCYLLDQHVLLTGDTLFPTGVGRPDLAADADELERRASELYASLQTLVAL